MSFWQVFFICISLFFCLVGYLPLFRVKHWSFRIFDFIRIQLLVILIALLIISFFVEPENATAVYLLRFILGISIVYQTTVIAPYFPLKSKVKETEKSIRLLSANVLQKNDEYQKLVEIIKNEKPDIVLSMESNSKWEQGLNALEEEFSFCHKIPKENRYGMHLYTNLEVLKCEEHHLISEEFPSIELVLKDKDNRKFVFWGVHLPPPSPTEKPTSKQKDAEMMQVAKRVKDKDIPVIISGDFNNVCWSSSSKLFAKMSGLTDARIGRGIYGTFPVKPKIFRFPIDLLFHSKTVKIHSITTLPDFGSDHLPLLSVFSLTSSVELNNGNSEKELEEKAKEIIDEGKSAAEEEN